MTKAECIICYDTLGLDKFRFLQCGHGACEECLNAQLERKRECPECREPVAAGFKPHPIFVTFVEDSANGKASRVLHHLNEFNEEPAYEKVTVLGKRTRAVAEQGGVDEELMDKLLAAADKLDTQILPLTQQIKKYKQAYATNAKLTKKNEVLLRERDDAREKLEMWKKAALEQEANVHHLSTRTQSLQESQSALAATNGELRAEMSRLRKQTQADRESYEGKISELEKQLKLQTIKAHALAREKTRQAKKMKRSNPAANDEPDEELMIIP